MCVTETAVKLRLLKVQIFPSGGSKSNTYLWLTASARVYYNFVCVTKSERDVSTTLPEFPRAAVK